MFSRGQIPLNPIKLPEKKQILYSSYRQIICSVVFLKIHMFFSWQQQSAARCITRSSRSLALLEVWKKTTKHLPLGVDLYATYKTMDVQSIHMYIYIYINVYIYIHLCLHIHVYIYIVGTSYCSDFFQFSGILQYAWCFTFHISKLSGNSQPKTTASWNIYQAVGYPSRCC